MPRWLHICLLPLLAAGCGELSDPASPLEEPAALGDAFNDAHCGTISGQVLWDGPVPRLSPYEGPISPRPESSHGLRHSWPHPRAPVITSAGQLASAVVFLRGVDPRRSRPWDHPTAQVELKRYQMYVRQGEIESRYGFVRRGCNVEVASQQNFFHAVQVRGAAFFTLPLADADFVHRRRLDRPGVVELTSASGCFWMGCWLFVDDHPYYVRTDSQGRFTLTQVPAGDYQLVCWLPDWREVSREIDADSWETASIQYWPALRIEQTVRVVAGKTIDVKATFMLPKDAQ